MIKGHGTVPDILALQEVENENVVAQLAKHTGYDHFVVTEQKNRRGVDLALLYKTKALRYVDHTEIRSPARSVLRVHFKTKPLDRNLFVYVNHWIAQSAPTLYRTKTAEALKEDIDEVNKEYNRPAIVMVGDFNTRFSEEDEVFNKHFMNPKWEHQLVEAHELSRDRYPHFSDYFPEGSYWRGRNNWQRFDRIFMSENLVDGSSKLRADLSSYRLIYSTEITGEYTFKEDKDDDKSRDVVIRYPLKFNFLENPKYPVGFTDHLPATVIIKN
ncbi:MAG: endonuclease/exonuclease/phosphatase family protein [Bdellovibrionales bacterium]|nr:endonuclease/exonuclease/phosphatase family protein [Bdellovibrionales bacterium]NQZ19445.1 endonuclease/exonuclease/phosphatase family protein [Bdellovibrionales bacterium]